MLNEEEIILLITDGINGNVSVKLQHDVNYRFWQLKRVAFNYPALSQIMDSLILYFYYYLSRLSVFVNLPSGWQMGKYLLILKTYCALGICCTES